MKTILSFALLLAFNAHASMEMGLVKFGSIGPSLESLPKASSMSEAKKLFQSLQKAQIGTIKIVDSRDGIMKCGNFSTPLKAAFACEMLVKMDSANVVAAASSGALTNVTFSGDIAKEIFSSMLTNSTTLRVGATTKSVGNLSCVKGANLTRKVTCTFRGVRFVKMAE